MTLHHNMLIIYITGKCKTISGNYGCALQSLEDVSFMLK